MTRIEAQAVAYRRVHEAGLHLTKAFRIVESVMTIFHEELTSREWLQFVDQEIEHQTGASI